MLLGCGADVTLENDNEETVLQVARDDLKKHIISEGVCVCGGVIECEREREREREREAGREEKWREIRYFISPESISHEDRSMSNAKALLQSAWLGDAVTVKRCLVSSCVYASASLSHTHSLSSSPSLSSPSLPLSLTHTRTHTYTCMHTHIPVRVTLSGCQQQ